MPFEPSRRSSVPPRAGLAAALLGALALALAVSAAAPDRSAAFDTSLDPSQIPRIPCGSQPIGVFDEWCGDWATDPPTLRSAPQKAFVTLGATRLERISEEEYLATAKRKPFGDATVDLDCADDALHYDGTYEGGQLLACTSGEAALTGVYREDGGDLRSGSFDISISQPRAFTGVLHQTLSGTPDNDWTGRCVSGWCATAVRPAGRLRCEGRPATVLGEANPLGANLIFGTPKHDVIVGTDEPDVIAGGAGDDRICGGDGRDVIVGNSGKDRLFGEGGDDLLRSSSLPGETESLIGGGGADNLRGGSGRDVMDPGPGRDVLEGGGGRDVAFYRTAPGRVSVILSLGVATGRGVGGVDSLIGIEDVVGSQFDDRLVGDGRENLILGEGGDDLIFGRAGRDHLHGGGGDDQLIGGPGVDALSGGAEVHRDVCRSGEAHQGCERVLR